MSVAFSPALVRTPGGPFIVIPDPVLQVPSLTEPAPVRHIICVREDRTRTSRRVKPRDFGLLLALGAMWGSSFLFIKVAVAEVEPAFVVACRLFFALLALVAVVPLLGRLSEVSEGPNLS